MLCIKAAPWLCTLPAGTRSPNYEVYIQKSFRGLRRSINKYATSFAPWVTDPLKHFSAPLLMLVSLYGRLFQTSHLSFWPKIIANLFLLLFNFILKFKVNKSWMASNKLKTERGWYCDVTVGPRLPHFLTNLDVNETFFLLQNHLKTIEGIRKHLFIFGHILVL